MINKSLPYIYTKSICNEHLKLIHLGNKILTVKTKIFYC